MFAWGASATGGTFAIGRLSGDDLAIGGAVEYLGGNLPPVIGNISQTPEAADGITAASTVAVSADVTDADGTVELVELRWGTISGSYPQTIAMVLDDGDTYVTMQDIPAQVHGTTVYYVIYAEDDEAFPVTSAEQSYLVWEPQITGLPFEETFDADLGDCFTYSVSGDTKFWIHGTFGGNGFAQMNGFNSGDIEEDWLILPGFDIDGYPAVNMHFETAYNYGSDDEDNFLKLLYSTDYIGVGDPTNATWTEISFTKPETGSYTWISSGDIDLSALLPEGLVWLGFRYRYEPGNYRTWQVDNIEIWDATEPVLEVAPETLAGLNYFIGFGPSPARSFHVTGINLSDDVTFTPPANFEASLLESGPFSDTETSILLDNGDVDQTVYVRLKETLSKGEYTGTLDLESGTLQASVALSGAVFESLAIPYSNDFRTQAELDEALEMGFSLKHYTFTTSAGGYVRFPLNGYVQTPLIDFTQYDHLLVEFSAASYGLGSDRKLDVKVSGDGGENFTVLYTAEPTSSTYDNYQFEVDLTDVLNTNQGLIRFEMTDGTGEVRFRDLVLRLVPVANPTFNPEGGFFLEPVTVSIETETEGATIYYSLESAEGPWTEYLVALEITDATTVWAYAEKVDMPDSEVVSATYTFYNIIEVEDIAALRGMWGAKTDQTAYKITGEVVLTLQSSLRNQKFIQDDSGAILIDDPAGIITTDYDPGDGITGITGTLSDFQNMLQFVPVVDPGTATNTGLEITPLALAFDELGPEHQAMLVTVYGVSFNEADWGEDFEVSTTYNVSDASGAGLLRTQYGDLDYLDPDPVAIPQGAHITGVVRQFNLETQITPRSMDDFFTTLFDFAVNPPPVEVIFGTDLAGAIAALPMKTTMEDHLGNVFEVDIIDWEISEYDGQTPGTYTATGVVVLPPWIGTPPTKDVGPVVTTGITVLDEPLAIPLSNWSLILLMGGMLGTALWMFRKGLA